MPLSKRAEKTLALLRQGRYYPMFDPKIPDCMDELIAAGLVVDVMRVETIRRCYVPAKGYTPYVPEKFDESK